MMMTMALMMIFHFWRSEKIQRIFRKKINKMSSFIDASSTV